MIAKPKDWETAQAYTGDRGPQMTPGGHICKIVALRQETSKNGNPMIVVAFDIDEGSELDGFYKAKLKDQQKQNKDSKWQGVIRFLLYGKDSGTNPYFKGFVKSLEESNAGYHWDWDERSPAGKKIGIVFREEEYMQETQIRSSVKAWQVRSVQAILDGVPVPPKKLLETHAAQPFDPKAGFVAVDDDELPF
jgi:hypothetical protein